MMIDERKDSKMMISISEITKKYQIFKKIIF